MAGLSLDSLSPTPTASGNKKPPKSASKQQPWWNRDIKLFGSGLNETFKETFYLEFASLTQAGLDIQSALHLLIEEQKKEKLRETLSQVESTLVAGSTLADAFRATPGFTPYEIYSLQIGEETGQLNTVLEQLAEYFRQRRKQRKQLVGALSYPAVILFTAIIAVSFMLSFIVPMFSEIFGRFGGELPKITQTIIDLSGWMANYGLLVLITIAAISTSIYLLRQKTWMRKFGSWLVQRVPVVGPIMVGLNLARFCQALSLLVAAQVPLLRALELLREMIPFYPIQSSLQEVEKGIMQGKAFHTCLRQHKIYDHRLVSLVKVGEEVNQLDTFFARLAAQYTDQVEQRTSTLNTFLEPFMIIFLGGIIGVILVSMYLPMFQLGSSFGG